jgi:pseudouridine-5'-phosphate glycosidase
MIPRIRLGGEVGTARSEDRPVVALETSVIGQGLPHPWNVECVERMSDAIRAAGAVPAWVGVLGGDVVVGLSDADLSGFSEPGGAEKVARRDLPAACARGGPGATTVSATIWAAARGSTSAPRAGSVACTSATGTT